MNIIKLASLVFVVTSTLAAAAAVGKGKAGIKLKSCHLYHGKIKDHSFSERSLEQSKDPSTYWMWLDKSDPTYGYSATKLTETNEITLISGKGAALKSIFKIVTHSKNEFHYTLNKNDACSVKMLIDPLDNVEVINVELVTAY